MKHYPLAWLILLAVLLWLVNDQAQVVAQQRRVLFTEEEATQLRLTDKEWQPIPRTRTLSRGPQIMIRQPGLTRTSAGPTIEATVPTDLLVVFEEHHAPVDMNSLQVKAKRGFFSKSLTDRLRPYIRGTTLAVDRIEIPQGRFRIEISIADIMGIKTVETYHLWVGER